MSQYSKISRQSSKTPVQRTWNNMEPRPFPSQAAQNAQLDTDSAASANLGNYTGMSFYGAPPIQRQEAEETAAEAIPTSEEDLTLQRQAEEGEELPEDAPVQAKLSVGKPGDKYEQEADSMAAKVMAMPEPTQTVQRQEEGEEETIQPKPLAEAVTPLVQRQTGEAASGDSGASSGLESQLGATKGGGSPLSDEVRGFMEPRFEADFSGVRVHTGGDAVQMNRELGAQAFTHGQDIYYGKGKSPGKDDLTAHELTHVVQQSSHLAQSIRKQENSSNQPEVNITERRLYTAGRKVYTAFGEYLVVPNSTNTPYDIPCEQITEAQFKEITEVWNELHEGNKIQIHEKDEIGREHSGFRRKTLKQLGKLFSKPKGRELITKLIKGNHRVAIVPSENDNHNDARAEPTHQSAFESEDGNPGARGITTSEQEKISKLNYGSSTIIKIDPRLNDSRCNFVVDDKGTSKDTPVFITLGHELIHAKHNSEGRNKRKLHAPKEARKGYSNKEEFQTIQSGEITENDLRNEHGLPRRFTHQGTCDLGQQ